MNLFIIILCFILFIIYTYFNQCYYWYNSQKLQKGRYHAEDGIPATGSWSFGAGPWRASDAVDVSHHSHWNRASSGPSHPRPREHYHRSEEPTLRQHPSDSSLGGGAVKEKEAFWDFKCEYTVETTFKNGLCLLAGVFVFWCYVRFICDNRKFI